MVDIASVTADTEITGTDGADEFRYEFADSGTMEHHLKVISKLQLRILIQRRIKLFLLMSVVII